MGKMPIVKRRRARGDPTPEKEAGAREKEGGRAVACPYELAGEGGGQAIGLDARGKPQGASPLLGVGARRGGVVQGGGGEPEVPQPRPHADCTDSI